MTFQDKEVPKGTEKKWLGPDTGHKYSVLGSSRGIIASELSEECSLYLPTLVQAHQDVSQSSLNLWKEGKGDWWFCLIIQSSWMLWGQKETSFFKRKLTRKSQTLQMNSSVIEWSWGDGMGIQQEPKLLSGKQLREQESLIVKSSEQQMREKHQRDLKGARGGNTQGMELTKQDGGRIGKWVIRLQEWRRSPTEDEKV